MMERIVLLSFITILLLTSGAEARDSTFYTQQSIEQKRNRKKIESVEDMITIFYGKVVSIYVPRIKNRTTSVALPNDISIMVRSLFNSIGNHVSLRSRININNLPKEDIFIINGAITAFDPNGESIEQGLQLSGEGKQAGEELSLSIKDNSRTKISKIGIIFNPSSAKTGNYISRTSTSNTIDIREISDSDGTTYSLFGVSLHLEESGLSSDGVHHSLRKLVEISTIEVLGRLVKYPYWLLTRGEVNNDIVEYLSNAFIRDTLKNKLKKISYLLSLRDSSIAVTSNINNQLRSAIINYKREHGLTPNDIISSRLYRSLLGA